MCRGASLSASRGPIVTLDGPAGSGKSTTAKAVAERLGYRHLDSGGLYRALTLALLEAAIPVARWAELSEEDLQALDVRVSSSGTSFDILVGGRRVSEELRSREVTEHVPFLASLAPSRASLLHLQRLAGEDGYLVADGRDMGTVVYPSAQVKVYLVADLQQRAVRRLKEVGHADPTDEEVDAAAAALAARDRQDSEREHSPLRKPEGAHLIDTTRLDFEEQVATIEALARAVEQG